MYFSVMRGCLQGHLVSNPTFQNVFATQMSKVLFSKRFKSKKTQKPDNLGSCTILIQDGCNVQELPLIIRKVKNALAPQERFPGHNPFHNGSYPCNSEIHRLIHKEFLKCLTYKEVVSLISNCSNLSPNVAVGAIERIFNINESLGPENIPRCDIKTVNDDLKKEVLDRLMNIIITCEDVNCIMNAIGALLEYTGQEALQDALVEELLDRVTDKKLSVHQLCRAVQLFSQFKKYPKSAENIEKLWIGFIDREKEFRKDDLVITVEVLPHLKASRRMVLGIVERVASSLWWQLSCEDVLRILHTLDSNAIPSPRLLTFISRWVNTNVHTLAEDAFAEIISKFTQMKFTNNEMEKALERYMKAKGIRITSHMLVVSVLNHCSNFRLRNAHILNGCAEYLVVHARDLPPPFLKPLFHPFGWLNFNPANRIKFWKEIETAFDDKFYKMNAEDSLDIMLSCIYLQKYPLNFIDKIFNPQFLERVNRASDPAVLRNKLKLLDMALSLESEGYGKPLLPRDARALPLRHDFRVRRLVLSLRQALEAVAGGADSLSLFVLPVPLFPTEVYVVEAVLHPPGLRSSLMSLRLPTDRGVATALLVHPPEHYSSDGTTLLGPQVMRKKHFRLVGMKVVSLNFDKLSRLKMYGKDLNTYLVESIKNAEPVIS